MNILIVTATFPPSMNGVAVSTARTVSELCRFGHHVWVIGPDQKHHEIENYISLPTLHQRLSPKDYPLPLPILSARKKRLLTEKKWDIVHVHHPSAFGKLALRLGKQFQAPVVFTYHTQYDRYIAASTPWLPRDIRTHLFNSQVLDFCQNVTAVIATTQWMQKELQTQIERPIFYVSTAGIKKPFLLIQSQKELRHQIGLPANEPVFLAVSRLVRVKQIDLLINAFAHWLKQKNQGILVIVGDGADRNRLEQLTRTVDVSKRVKFVGKVANEKLPVYYSLADVFLYSSTSDTIGINIIEAMSARLPIVAVDHVSTQEVVSPESGFLTKEDPKALARAMQRAYDDRKKVGLRAFNESKKYLLKNVTKTLVQTYTHVVNDYQRHRN